jgi:hypothetical protein
MSKQNNCPGELNIRRTRSSADTTGILARLQQELSAARSRNAAAEIFSTAEGLLNEDDLDSFTAYYTDILHELPE